MTARLRRMPMIVRSYSDALDLRRNTPYRIRRLSESAEECVEAEGRVTDCTRGGGCLFVWLGATAIEWCPNAGEWLEVEVLGP